MTTHECPVCQETLVHRTHRDYRTEDPNKVIVIHYLYCPNCTYNKSDPENPTEYKDR